MKERYYKIQEIYHSSRPRPPKVLINLIKQLTNREKLDLIVDLGCGTGTSTTFWSGISQKVIGLDISTEMVEFAKNIKKQDFIDQSNIEYIRAGVPNTGIENDSVDLVYISQAIHWMDPEEILKEVVRVLKPGGLFLALNCNLNPLFDISSEINILNFWERVNSLRNKLDIKNESIKWTIYQHYDKFQSCKQIRYIRKVKFCSDELGDSNRILELIKSVGMINVLFQKNISYEEMGMPDLEYELGKWGSKEFHLFFSFEGFIAQKL